MNERKVFSGVLSVLLCAAMLWGCGKEEQAGPVTTEPSTQAQVQPETPEDPNDVAVVTPYGTLYHQEQWAANMRTEQAMDGTNVAVSFQGVIGETAYPLFQVIIGSMDADPVGELTDSSGTKREVYIIAEDSLEHPELTAEDLELLYGMQEDINYIIEKLN